eukprot:TRINITY_DN20685_c0_g1_i1.p1 TRINITY_DN20685_c0_g1~~TRINITY_DN20685_c0_g1_i1.p1  ORF type:complete len:949 (+),score=200.88 TRINITY_DN20685_c0_g1_i1:55-2901(+)
MSAGFDALGGDDFIPQSASVLGHAAPAQSQDAAAGQDARRQAEEDAEWLRQQLESWGTPAVSFVRPEHEADPPVPSQRALVLDLLGNDDDDPSAHGAQGSAERPAEALDGATPSVKDLSVAMQTLRDSGLHQGGADSPPSPPEEGLMFTPGPSTVVRRRSSLLRSHEPLLRTVTKVLECRTAIGLRHRYYGLWRQMPLRRGSSRAEARATAAARQTTALEGRARAQIVEAIEARTAVGLRHRYWRQLAAYSAARRVCTSDQLAEHLVDVVQRLDEQLAGCRAQPLPVRWPFMLDFRRAVAAALTASGRFVPGTPCLPSEDCSLASEPGGRGSRRASVVAPPPSASRRGSTRRRSVRSAASATSDKKPAQAEDRVARDSPTPPPPPPASAAPAPTTPPASAARGFAASPEPVGGVETHVSGQPAEAASAASELQAEVRSEARQALQDLVTPRRDEDVESGAATPLQTCRGTTVAPDAQTVRTMRTEADDVGRLRYACVEMQLRAEDAERRLNALQEQLRLTQAALRAEQAAGELRSRDADVTDGAAGARLCASDIDTVPFLTPQPTLDSRPLPPAAVGWVPLSSADLKRLPLEADTAAGLWAAESDGRVAVSADERWVRCTLMPLARSLLTSLRAAGATPRSIPPAFASASSAPPRAAAVPQGADHARRLASIDDIGQPVATPGATDGVTPPRPAVPRLALARLPGQDAASQRSGRDDDQSESLVQRAAAASARSCKSGQRPPWSRFVSSPPQPKQTPAEAWGVRSPRRVSVNEPPLPVATHGLYSLASPFSSPERLARPLASPSYRQGRGKVVMRGVAVSATAIGRQVLGVVLRGVRMETALCGIDAEVVRNACLSRGRGPAGCAVIDATGCSESEACAAAAAARDAAGKLCLVLAVLPPGSGANVDDLRDRLKRSGCEEDGFISAPPMRRELAQKLVELGAVSVDDI